MSAILKANEMRDTRPMWKILKEQEKCDVLSIPEVEEENPSPLEIARRKRAFNVIHQNYLNLSWHDVLFMKTIRKNPNLLLDQCKNSRNFLANLSQTQYDIVRRFIVSISRYKILFNSSISASFPTHKEYDSFSESSVLCQFPEVLQQKDAGEEQRGLSIRHSVSNSS